MVAPSGEQCELVDGDLEAVVVEVGGGLRTLTLGGHDLLDGYAADAMADSGRGQLLAPWPNRIEDGRYTFDGTEEQLPLTEVAHHNAIHGLVRWVSWVTVQREADRVVLEHVIQPQPGYPFRLRLQVTYQLRDGLTVTTTATNEGDRTAPYGFGAHPYLAAGTGRVDDLVLRSPATTVIGSDPRGIPRDRRTVAGTPYDFREPRPVGELVLDHAFTDLVRDDDGRASVVVTDPAAGVVSELWMDQSFGHLMIYSGDTLAPSRRRCGLAVEPMTCPPNAFRTGEGVIRLAPGTSTTSTWGIRAWRSPPP